MKLFEIPKSSVDIDIDKWSKSSRKIFVFKNKIYIDDNGHTYIMFTVQNESLVNIVDCPCYNVRKSEYVAYKYKFTYYCLVPYGDQTPPPTVEALSKILKKSEYYVHDTTYVVGKVKKNKASNKLFVGDYYCDYSTSLDDPFDIVCSDDRHDYVNQNLGKGIPYPIPTHYSPEEVYVKAPSDPLSLDLHREKSWERYRDRKEKINNKVDYNIFKGSDEELYYRYKYTQNYYETIGQMNIDEYVVFDDDRANLPSKFKEGNRRYKGYFKDLLDSNTKIFFTDLKHKSYTRDTAIFNNVLFYSHAFMSKMHTPEIDEIHVILRPLKREYNLKKLKTSFTEDAGAKILIESNASMYRESIDNRFDMDTADIIVDIGRTNNMFACKVTDYKTRKILLETAEDLYKFDFTSKYMATFEYG